MTAEIQELKNKQNDLDHQVRSAKSTLDAIARIKDSFIVRISEKVNKWYDKGFYVYDNDGKKIIDRNKAIKFISNLNFSGEKSLSVLFRNKFFHQKHETTFSNPLHKVSTPLNDILVQKNDTYLKAVNNAENNHKSLASTQAKLLLNRTIADLNTISETATQSSHLPSTAFILNNPIPQVNNLTAQAPATPDQPIIPPKESHHAVPIAPINRKVISQHQNMIFSKSLTIMKKRKVNDKPQLPYELINSLDTFKQTVKTYEANAPKIKSGLYAGQPPVHYREIKDYLSQIQNQQFDPRSGIQYIVDIAAKLGDKHTILLEAKKIKNRILQTIPKNNKALIICK